MSKLPEVPTLKDHNWLDTVHELSEKDVQKEVELLKQIMQTEKLETLQDQDGGRGMLGGPPVTISAALRAAAPGLNPTVLENMKEFIGDYDPQWPRYLALFRIQWDSLTQFMQYARRYMARQDWNKFNARASEELSKLGLV